MLDLVTHVCKLSSFKTIYTNTLNNKICACNLFQGAKFRTAYYELQI